MSWAGNFCYSPDSSIHHAERHCHCSGHNIFYVNLKQELLAAADIKSKAHETKMQHLQHLTNPVDKGLNTDTWSRRVHGRVDRGPQSMPLGLVAACLGIRQLPLPPNQSAHEALLGRIGPLLILPLEDLHAL